MSSADRLIEVFSEAKARPVGAARDLFLAEACRDEPALKEQVLRLLQAHEGAGDFLKHTLFVPPVSPLTEKPGDKIGRYKLLEQIGEGGCGAVYMAEQQEPVHRRVALKVIKLGMDTKSVIARFEAERQALAMMDHPNIAKVLDAGATETGRPYFVMELVRGIRITDYCDQNNISTEERLKLFTQVCQAIQHAHQKGIIHRDIKPSNILVTVSEPGAPGCPKVIDFGIAKATTGERLTDKTVFTAFEQFIGTPAYMSPEQAMMTSLDIDTRTDIYALGVLLYELLTGTTPFDAKDLMAVGLDAMRRTILEQEPARPSTRLSTMLEADLTVVAKHRHSESTKLGPLLRGDLDWIVMKALEKDRTRRYETASGLAADVQRHLSNEPVAARPPSRAYQFQKLVRRNKLPFAAAGAVAAALIIGLGVSMWMFFREKEARQRAVGAEEAQSRLRQEAEAEKQNAQIEAVKSKEVAQFLRDMLYSASPWSPLGRDTPMPRELLDKTAEHAGISLKNQPEVEAELRSTLAQAYLGVGAVGTAETMERESLRLKKSVFGETNKSVAESLDSLAFLLCIQDKLEEAETTADLALAMNRKLYGDQDVHVAGALDNLGIVRRSQGRHTEAELMLREALAMKRKMVGNENKDVAWTLFSLAVALQRQGKLAEAETRADEAVTMYRRLYGSAHPYVAISLSTLGDVFREEGKLAEAERSYGECFAMRIKLFGHKHFIAAASLPILISTLLAQQKFAEAEQLTGEFLAAREKKVPDDWQTRSLLGGILFEQKKYAEAEPLLLSGYGGMKQRDNNFSGIDKPYVKETLQRLVQLYKSTGQSEKAAEWSTKLAEFDKTEAEKKTAAPQP